ncbi:acyl-CoA dehydrogenase [Streptomyces massasporeus]
MAVAAATARKGALAGGPAPAAAPAALPSAADADRRAARLEVLLGDPCAPDNPHGLSALFAAGAGGGPPEQTHLLLERFQLSAECVPAAHGGRLTRADLLARVLRPLFRRDVALGMAAGTAPVLAAGPIWAAGSTRRRARAAALLLGGGRIAAVPHGRGPSAATAGGITARPAPGGGLLLDGRAETAPGASDARLYVVQARTGPARSPHSHSAVLLEGERLASSALYETDTAAAPGGFGAARAEIELHEHPVPPDAVLGPVGEGVALALRTQQVGHALVPALLVAAADTALRSAVRAAGPGSGASPARRRLAGVFADILACDSFAGVALRALSLLPAQAQVPAAAVNYLVPALLQDNLEALACVLGARRHERTSAHHGALGRLMRALPLAAAGPARAGAAEGQSVIAPHLRPLAEHCWFSEPEPPPALFRGGSDLPVLDFAALAAAGHGDVLAASLCGSAARFDQVRGVGGHTAALAELVHSLLTELHALRARCRALPRPGHGPLPVAVVCALVDRYALVLAAAAVIGVWESQDGADPFLAAPAWPVLALSRIARRLGAPVPPLPDGVEDLVHRELVRRCHEHLSYDLDTTELAP